jgi:hypothetical protein
MIKLPPFPVDDATLGMLEAALNPRAHGDPDAQCSSVGAFLEFMSQLGGSDTKAVAEELGEGIVMMRDPQYHPNDLITALVAEVRRLRGAA